MTATTEKEPSLPPKPPTPTPPLLQIPAHLQPPDFVAVIICVIGRFFFRRLFSRAVRISGKPQSEFSFVGRRYVRNESAFADIVSYFYSRSISDTKTLFYYIETYNTPNKSVPCSLLRVRTYAMGRNCQLILLHVKIRLDFILLVINSSFSYLFLFFFWWKKGRFNIHEFMNMIYMILWRDWWFQLNEI